MTRLVAIPAVVWSVTVATVDVVASWAALALAVLVGSAWIASSRVDVRRWARQRGVDASANDLEAVERFLRRSTRGRSLGVGGGVAAVLVGVAHYNATGALGPWEPPEGPFELLGWWVVAMGYLIGTGWAFATSPPAQRGESRANGLLLHRRVTGYVDPALKAIVGAYAAAVLVFGVLWWVDGSRESGQWSWSATFTTVVLVAGAVLVAAVCRRRYRVTDQGDLAHEELTRSATTNAVAGMTVALMGQLLVQVAPRTDGVLLAGTTGVVVGALSMFGLGVWAASGTPMIFTSERTDRLRATAS